MTPLTLEALGQEAANDVTADAVCVVHGKLWEAGSQDLNGAVIQNGDSGVKIAELHVCSYSGLLPHGTPALTFSRYPLPEISASLTMDTLRDDDRIGPTQHHTHKWTRSARENNRNLSHTIVLNTKCVILNSGCVGHPHQTSLVPAPECGT